MADSVDKAQTCDQCPVIREDIASIKESLSAHNDRGQRIEDAQTRLFIRLDEIMDHFGQLRLDMGIFKESGCKQHDEFCKTTNTRLVRLESWRSQVLGGIAVALFLLDLGIRFFGK